MPKNLESILAAHTDLLFLLLMKEMKYTDKDIYDKHKDFPR